MKRTSTICAIGLLLSGTAFGEDVQQRVEASRAAAKQFGQTLKSELLSAIGKGGPTHALEVCHTRAPRIAEQISDEKGWDMGRTSLKPRNPDNAPDAWEASVLRRFKDRQARGEDPRRMEYYEIVEEGGEPYFRYMKAIPTGSLCLTCHGQSIVPAVSAKIERLYPQDQATGFEVGDIRGAFTIRQPM